MASMRAKGEGSIQKVTENGKVIHRGAIVIGYNDKKNPQRKTFRGKTAKEVKQKMDEYKKTMSRQKETVVSEENMTLEEFAHEWIFVTRYYEFKYATIERYEGIIRNYIKDTSIGRMKLTDIKSKDLRAYYDELCNVGKTENTIKVINKTIKSILEDAIKKERITKNVAKETGLIKRNYEAKPQVLNVFTIEEQEEFKEACRENRLRALLLLALGIGARQGELLGLTWDDVDFKTELISINKSVKQIAIIEKDGSRKYEWKTLIPKTKASIRDIPAPSAVMEILKQHKENQDKEKEKYQEIYLDKNFVFCTNLGLRINARNLLRAYSRLLKKAGIKYRKFHSLRHTYATRLFEKGIEAKKIQSLMGHSDIATTMNIYTHIKSEDLGKEVSVLDELFQ